MQLNKTKTFVPKRSYLAYKNKDFPVALFTSEMNSQIKQLIEKTQPEKRLIYARNVSAGCFIGLVQCRQFSECNFALDILSSRELPLVGEVIAL